MRLLWAIVAGTLLFTGCVKKKTGVRHTLITPSNVLISDASAEWLKFGVPMILQQDFAASQFTQATMVTTEETAAQLGAQDVLRTKVEQRQGKIFIEATVFDVASQKTTNTEEVEASSMAALIPAVNNLAKRLDETAQAFSTGSTEAARALVGFPQERNQEKRIEILKKAIDLDPNFGMCYFLLLELVASSGNDSYKALLADAKSHRAGFTPYDRARFDLLVMQLEHANLSQKTAGVEAMLKVAPNDAEGLSILSGIRFLKGDMNGGTAAIQKAISLNPTNIALRAQLAEGFVQSGRFAEAEKVLAKLEPSPAGLAELATVILLQGDVARATQTAEKLIGPVPNPDYQAVLRASWAELTGDRAKALEIAESAKFSNPNVRALALSEAAVWRMMNKDFAGAKKTADSAAAADNHPTAIGTVAGLLVSGDQSAEEWRKKVEASPLNQPMKQPILAYGFFLNGHYREAAVEWRKMLDASDNSDLRARVMLASSLERSGNAAEARKIAVQPFLIRDFADVYGSLVFSEMRRWTGNAGKR